MFKRNVVALGVYTANLAMNTKRGQKRKQLALCIAEACERKLYSEQYKRYKLSQSHHCGRAVIRTVVRSYCIHSGFYTGTVHSVQRC